LQTISNAISDTVVQHLIVTAADRDDNFTDCHCHQ